MLIRVGRHGATVAGLPDDLHRTGLAAAIGLACDPAPGDAALDVFG